MTKDSFVHRLSKLDSSAISDALDSLGMNGVVTRLQAVSVLKKICGRVVTMKLVPQGNNPRPSNRHLGTAAVEAASEGDIIVVEHGRTDVAGWGGNLSIAAQQRGVNGVLIDGACRDADEMRSIGFPVYARNVVPTTARGRIVEESFNQPIRIDQVDVAPGDLVLADGSGIVFIPADQAEKVLQAAEKITEKEALMAKAIIAGEPVSKVMGKSYETMLQGNINS
ncbi:RraA family protein [Bacillus thermotolerans]|uniref:RraA family protein n=1 Tax=Bacillus thermotolerans TaxID=1221996 RepID=UPI00058260F6|nr:hypothetical protein [Bacillus thermotolerans]KKB35181.1 Demethylmenaquinone methyltransferase [Bacillus thermotolerans]